MAPATSRNIQAPTPALCTFLIHWGRGQAPTVCGEPADSDRHGWKDANGNTYSGSHPFKADPTVLPSLPALQAAASALGQEPAVALRVAAAAQGDRLPWVCDLASAPSVLVHARADARADLQQAIFGPIADNGETHLALMPVPACAALFCGPPCRDPAHADAAEPAPADPELQAFMDAETAMEEYQTKLRTDPKERAKARKVYRDAFKAAGEDPKEAARKAAALVNMDREAF